jgi:flagellar motility protein MotE (MotC chaperone)
MPGRSAGLILANVNPEKAARLTRDISMRRAEQNQAAGTQ